MNAVNSIPEQYLWCRDVLHSWVPYDAKITKDHAGRREIHRILRCQRCQTRRKQRLSTNGMILGNTYDYSQAPGYLNKGQGRMTAEDNARLRLHSLEVNTDIKVKKK